MPETEGADKGSAATFGDLSECFHAKFVPAESEMVVHMSFCDVGNVLRYPEEFEVVRVVGVGADELQDLGCFCQRGGRNEVDGRLPGRVIQ